MIIFNTDFTMIFVNRISSLFRLKNALVTLCLKTLKRIVHDRICCDFANVCVTRLSRPLVRDIKRNLELSFEKVILYLGDEWYPL